MIYIIKIKLFFKKHEENIPVALFIPSQRGRYTGNNFLFKDGLMCIENLMWYFSRPRTPPFHTQGLCIHSLYNFCSRTFNILAIGQFKGDAAK